MEIAAILAAVTRQWLDLGLILGLLTVNASLPVDLHVGRRLLSGAVVKQGEAEAAVYATARPPSPSPPPSPRPRRRSPEGGNEGHIQHVVNQIGWSARRARPALGLSSA
eukprot:tig00000381_g24528.t1